VSVWCTVHFMKLCKLFIIFTDVALFHLLLYRKNLFNSTVFVIYLKLGPHDIWRNRAEVEDAHWGAGVQGLAAEVAVGVTQNTAQRLGVTNLAAWVQVVLVTQDLVWAELAKVLGGNNVAGDQAGGRHGLTDVVAHAHRGGHHHGRLSGTAAGHGPITNIGADHAPLALGGHPVPTLPAAEQEEQNNDDEDNDRETLAIHLY